MSVVSATERKEIDEYLKFYCLEDCIDEAINEVVEKRPTNPYKAIANSMESKTMAEIMEVFIHPMIVGHGHCGVQVIIETNLDKFTAVVSSSLKKTGDDITMSIDFSIDEEKLRESLKSLDPRNLNKIDSILENMHGIHASIVLAASIACCRAAARHRGQPLHTFIATCAETLHQIIIPMPVISILTRNPNSFCSQDITITSTRSNHLSSALEIAMKISNNVKEKIHNDRIQLINIENGCYSLKLATLEDAVKFVSDVLQHHPAETKGVKLGVDVRSHLFVNSDNIYNFETAHRPIEPSVPSPRQPTTAATGVSPKHIESLPTAGNKNGTIVCDNLFDLWIASELISIEDPFSLSDQNALRLLKTKIKNFTNEVLNEKSDKLSYCMRGVGGDSACVLQLTADHGVFSVEDLEAIKGDGTDKTAQAYNTIKIQLYKLKTVSKAIQLCTMARKSGFGLIGGYDEDAYQNSDTFLSDFCVGLGIGQMAGGGLLSGEAFSKYNRLLEIAREFPDIPFAGTTFRR